MQNAVPIKLETMCKRAAKLSDDQIPETVKIIVADCSTSAFQYSHEVVLSKIQSYRELINTPAHQKAVKAANQEKREREPSAVSGPPPNVRLKCFADIEIESVKWIWPDRFPAKVTILSGVPGQGKSTFVAELAAIISTGRDFPDGQPCEKGSVIYMGAEDGAGDTTGPRLKAAGADMDRVHLMEGIWNAQGEEADWDTIDGYTTLIETLEWIGDVRLIVLDPVVDFFKQSINTNNATDVRRALRPLQKIANDFGVAIMMIGHPNKSQGVSALDKFAGSGAFTQVARVAYMVGKHPDVEDAMCVAIAKKNIVKQKTAMAYRIVSCQWTTEKGEKVDVGKVEWMDNIDVDADDLVGPSDTGKTSALDEAISFLKYALADGPMESRKVKSVAKENGFKERTLNEAKARLGIRSKKEGRTSFWELAADPHFAK